MGRPRGDARQALRLSLKNAINVRSIENGGEDVNPTFAKAIAALVPTGMLLVGSTLQFFRRKRTATVFQLIGAACLVVVVIAHLCEALGWFPWMHWGSEHSVGHYIDLLAAIGGLALFPIGYLFGALTREVV